MKPSERIYEIAFRFCGEEQAVSLKGGVYKVPKLELIEAVIMYLDEQAKIPEKKPNT